MSSSFTSCPVVIGSMSLSLFPLSSADPPHAAHMRTSRTTSSTVLPNEPPILADPCMSTPSLLLRRRRLYCAQSGDRPLARWRTPDPFAACSLEVNAALPAGFTHALESWVRAIFWRLRSGLEVRENTGKRAGAGRLIRNPVDQMWSNVRRSCPAVDSRASGNDGYVGSNRIRIALVQPLVQQVLQCGSD